MSKVPVQKGKIQADQPTIGQQDFAQRVTQAITEGAMRKGYQTMTLMEPKTSNK